MDGRYKTWKSKTLCRTENIKKSDREQKFKIIGGEIMSTRGHIAIKENGKYIKYCNMLLPIIYLRKMEMKSMLII